MNSQKAQSQVEASGQPWVVSIFFFQFVLQFFFFFLTGCFYFIYLFPFCAACFNTTATPKEGCGRPRTPASVERKGLIHVACF